MARPINRPENRRTRMEPGLDPQLRNWLTRVTRIHSHLCSIVRLLGQPSKADQLAGGQTVTDQDYADRVRAGDPSILADSLTYAVDVAQELLAEVQAKMDDVQPCDHPPGSAGKVAAMQQRASIGRSLFVAGDRPTDIR